MKHLSTIGSAALLGSMGIVVMNSITGCSGQQQQEPQNRFLVIEQQPGGKYIVVEEMPTEGPSRAIISERDENGVVTERFMNEEEMRRLAEQFGRFVSGLHRQVFEEHGKVVRQFPRIDLEAVHGDSHAPARRGGRPQARRHDRRLPPGIRRPGPRCDHGRAPSRAQVRNRE